MKQKHFMDIENLREEDTELRLGNGHGFDIGDTIQVTEKIDGSNACITYDEETDSLVAFSRKQELSYNNTLSGFWNYAQNLDKEVFKQHKSWRVFGEWSGAKNKIIYDERFKKKWIVYDIFDTETEKWQYQSTVKTFCKEAGFEYIHELYYGPFISWDHCKTFLHNPGYGDKQEGCFSSLVKILMSDGSQKYIKDIQKGDMVKSYNVESNTIEDKIVTNVFYNGLKPYYDWFMLTLFPRGSSGSKLINGKTLVTTNHLFYDGKSYSSISDLNDVYHYGIKFDNFRFNAFLGMMCSDGNLNKQTFKYSQKKENMYHIENLFNDYINKRRPINISGKGSQIQTILFTKQITYPIYSIYGLSENRFDYIKAFRDMNDIGWAFFFIGDGCCHKKQGTVDLQFASYTCEEFDDILSIFSNRFDVNPTIYMDKRVQNGSGKGIRLNKEDSKKFIKRIARYVIPSHRYKLQYYGDIDDYIGDPDVEYGIVKRHIYKKVNINQSHYTCRYGRKNIGAWDIEVKDNHNYFANGCLVHNCVVKNMTALNNPNTREPFYLKIVNDDFKESMKVHEKVIDPEVEKAKEEARKIIEAIITKNRVEKELYKMRDEGLLPEKLQPSDMKLVAQSLPKRICDDCMKEERELVMQCGEYFGKMASGQTMQIARSLILGE